MKRSIYGNTTNIAAAAHSLDTRLKGKLDHVRATVQIWNNLDTKTRGILATCLLDALSPLISLETRRYLESGRGGCFQPEEITEGRIMVFSMSAARYRESASLLGRLIKARLYAALQGRSQDRNQRVCAILADEFHYLATGGSDRSSDVTAIATLRSRSVALITATQSLDHLGSVMGRHDFAAMLPNFGNVFFFRSNEASAGVLATAMMGTRPTAPEKDDGVGDLVVGHPRSKAVEWICPPGALTQLEPCQAYVALSTGYRSPGMIWLAGQFEQPTLPFAANGQGFQCDDALQKLREVIVGPRHLRASVTKVSSESNPLYYEFDEWSRLLRQRRFQATSFENFGAFSQVLAQGGSPPVGLESLPPCWWDALATLSLDFAKKHPLRFVAIRQVDGCIEVMLSGTTSAPEIYLSWIAKLEKSLYPIRSRRLKKRDGRFLDEAF